MRKVLLIRWRGKLPESCLHPPERYAMLSQAKVAQYLLEHGLVSPQSVVEGDLVVSDFTRRNVNFRVAGK